jgi:hypothetical protein
MNYFLCNHCNKKVKKHAPGTKNRNHCPFCLFSLHVDNSIGDRKNDCRGKMAPIGKYYKPDEEEVIIHKCENCGEIRKNRVAGDDNWDLVEKLEVYSRNEFGF